VGRDKALQRASDPGYIPAVVSRSKKTLPITDAEAISEQVRARLAQRHPFLVVIAGDDVGLRHRLLDSCTVGRDPDCDVVLRDARASARHARFEMRDNEVHLVDLESTNGTFVNEQRVKDSPVRNGDKVFIGSTVMRLDWQDALEQDFHEELERLLSIDDLTGLLAKRRFDTEAGLLVDTTLQRGAPVTVLMMDLDGIKKINDTHGHTFGAYCIAEAGAVIRKVLGVRGVATRWGGDEYSAVLPDHDAERGRAVGEEILEAIRNHPFERESIRLHPGVSIGLAVGPESGATLEALQRSADDALYRAKRAGKGRVSD
jgi:diguanylate cyclase (GGDEF)-like protein